MALSAALFTWTATSVTVIYVSSRFEALEWLGYDALGAVWPAGCAVGVLGVYARWGPRLVHRAWFLVPVLLFPIAVFAMVIGAAVVHVTLGTPIHSCRSELDVTEACHGRDWSLIQAHVSVLRATGRLRRHRCERFVSAVAPTRSRWADDHTARGWGHCPLSLPERWAEVPCDEVLMGEYARCFECGSRSRSNNDFVSLLAVDARCEQANLTHLVGMTPAEAAVASPPVVGNPALRPWSYGPRD